MRTFRCLDKLRGAAGRRRFGAADLRQRGPRQRVRRRGSWPHEQSADEHRRKVATVSNFLVSHNTYV